MSYTSLGLLTADSWVNGSDRLLVAYRAYTSKGTTCSKFSMGLNAIIHTVKTVAYAILLPLAFAVSFFSGNDKGLEILKKISLHADFTEASFKAMRQCKATMESLRAPEARSFCHTLLFPNDSRLNTLVHWSQELGRFEKERMKLIEEGLMTRLKNMDTKDLIAALSLDLHAYPHDVVERFLEILSKLDKKDSVAFEHLDGKIGKRLYAKLQIILLKRDRTYLFCYPNHRQKLELFCPDLKPRFVALERKEGEGAIAITAQQEQMFNMLKKF